MIALLANVPNPVPAAMSFRRYHLDHHTYQVGCRCRAVRLT